MEKSVYYIPIESNIKIGIDTPNIQNSQETMTLQAVLHDISLSHCMGEVFDKVNVDETSYLSKDLSYLILEGSIIPEEKSWDCLFLSYPCHLREYLISRIDMSNDMKMDAVMEQISKEYDYVIEEIESRMRDSLKDNETKSFVVMKNLSFGDICLIYPSGKYDYEYMYHNVNAIFTAFIEGLKPTTLLDSPTDLIETKCKSIKKRFESNYLFVRNSNYNEYAKLLKKMATLNVGSNDRRMYMIMLDALLLRTILDETSARWIYESGDLKFESEESVLDLSQAYEVRKNSFDIFLDQAQASSPYSDQIWSLFFVTKTLLSSLVGRTMQEIASVDDVLSKESVAKEEIIKRQGIYSNFFGFVPYIGTRYNEVTSYYPSHLSPDYCYGFLSIPRKNRFNLWSYFPAYIHEFFHYIPPRGRKERNEKILHLAIYTIMNPLYVEMTEERRTQYETIVQRIAEIIDNYRQDLIDIRNDYVYEGKVHSQVDIQKVEDYRDTMKYNAIMHDLIKVLDFEGICMKAIEDVHNSNSFDRDLETIIQQMQWKQECLNSWDQDATSYIATYSFALREIRSDISMCLMLNMGLKEYIELLANEPAFAECSAQWVADSTVLRFGFVTRLLYMKEYMGYQTWGEVNWDELCDRMLSTTLKQQSYNESSPYLNTIECWNRCCNEIINQFSHEVAITESFSEHLKNLKEYIVAYQTIMSVPSNEWYSVFERALCAEEYSIHSQDKELSCLISNWGKQLSAFETYAFPRQLYYLYKKYNELQNDIERYQFEYRSRLLFRDLLMAFPDIDLDR
ncbi:MAG: hypothetical protein J6S14_21620 [Clostridia bacterium]|nr:hypothetical protein [Clostridia bacterium]